MESNDTLDGGDVLPVSRYGCGDLRLNLDSALAQRQQAIETGVERAPGLAGVLRQEEIAVLQSGDERLRAATRGDQRVGHVRQRAYQPGTVSAERFPGRVSPFAVEDRLASPSLRWAVRAPKLAETYQRSGSTASMASPQV